MVIKTFVFIVITIFVFNISQSNNIKKSTQYDNCERSLNDSSFVIYTVKEYSRLDWYWFNNYSLLYKISNDEIKFFIIRMYYDNKKNKMIVWVGKKMYNAPSIKKYNDDERINRICPIGGDTLFSTHVLIGYKDSINNLWKLYPWGNRQISCASSLDQAVKELEQYYLDDIKEDYFEGIVQNGKLKGKIEKKYYQFTIDKSDFWTKSPLWQPDSVGSMGLYPFEIKSYGYGLVETCIKCGEMIALPKINYPDTLTNSKK